MVIWKTRRERQWAGKLVNWTYFECLKFSYSPTLYDTLVLINPLVTNSR